jgi:hypothetical protein
MYDFYQVERIHFKFIPYKWELTASSVGINTVFAEPTYCCIDPESTGPDVPSAIASYGNMTVTKPYEVMTRTLQYH